MSDPDKVLFVVAKGDEVLEAWSPFHARSTRPTLFDPDEIKYVVGVHGGLIRAVYRVTAKPGTGERFWKTPDERNRPGRYRIAFHGTRTMRPLEGRPSPVVWSQGQGTPVRAVHAEVLESLVTDVAVPTADAADGGRDRAVFGDAVLTREPDGSITVTVPASTAVTVRAVVPGGTGTVR